MRVTGINFDVTDQRRAEEVVSRSEALLSATVNTTDDAIVALDRDLRITMMNEALRIAVRRYFGVEPAIGMEATHLVVPERQEEVRGMFARVLAGERQRAESMFRTPAGEVRYADELYNPIFDAAGKVIGASVFVRDVTSRRHAEQTIQAVVKGTSASLGEQFFRSLVLELAAALNTRYALVAEVASPGAHPVCGHMRGRPDSREQGGRSRGKSLRRSDRPRRVLLCTRCSAAFSRGSPPDR